MVGIFLGRPRAAPAIVGGAVLILLAVNPTLVYSIGFQLSVAATAGMALLANGQVSSLVDGVKLARATLNEGKARHKLEEVVACSHALVR